MSAPRTIPHDLPSLLQTGGPVRMDWLDTATASRVIRDAIRNGRGHLLLDERGWISAAAVYAGAALEEGGEE